MLMGLLITTGEVHELTDQLERVADWIIRRRRLETEVFAAMKGVRPKYLPEGSKEIQVLMYKWRTIIDEGEMSTSGRLAERVL